MNQQNDGLVSASRFIAECDAGTMCQCGHVEHEHETVEYRGSKPRSCLSCKPCMAFQPVDVGNDATPTSEMKTALRDLAYCIVSRERQAERLKVLRTALEFIVTECHSYQADAFSLRVCHLAEIALTEATGVVRTAVFEVQDDWIDDGTETKKPATRELPAACNVCGARWVCEHQP